MENKVPNINNETVAISFIQRHLARLPFVALGLVLSPLITAFLSNNIFFALLVLLLPATGMITSVVYLCFNRNKTTPSGKIIAWVAIALPLIPLAFFIYLYIGFATGTIGM